MCKQGSNCTQGSDLQDPWCNVCRTHHSKERTDEVCRRYWPRAEDCQGMFWCSTCIRTYHWDCLMQIGCYHNRDACPSTTNQQKNGTVQPARTFWGATGNSDLLRSSRELGRTKSEIWLVNWMGANTRSSKDDQIKPWLCKNGEVVWDKHYVHLLKQK